MHTQVETIEKIKQAKWKTIRHLDTLNGLAFEIEKCVEETWHPAYTLPNPITNEIFEVTEDFLDLVTDRMAQQLIIDFKGQTPLFIGLMDGASYFADKLLAAIDRHNNTCSTEEKFDYHYTSLRTSSYEGTSSGNLTIAELKQPVGGRLVILIDDVVETGKSLQGVIDLLTRKGARDIKTTVMANKYTSDRTIQPDYYGLMLDFSKFIVGFGMDYLTPKFRRLPCMMIVDEKHIATKEEMTMLRRIKPLNLKLEQLSALEIQLAKGSSMSISSNRYSSLTVEKTSANDSNASIIEELDNLSIDLS